MIPAVVSALIAGSASWALWMRKTLPLHPVALGCAFGSLPGVVQTTALEGWWVAPMYYATAGLMSTWCYSVIRAMLKKKTGILLPETPDAISMPPKP